MENGHRSARIASAVWLVSDAKLNVEVNEAKSIRPSRFASGVSGFLIFLLFDFRTDHQILVANPLQIVTCEALMIHGFLVVAMFCNLVFCSFAFSQSGLNGNKDRVHDWSEISYPDLASDFGDGNVSAAISRRDEGLSLRLSFSWKKTIEENEGFTAPDGAQIKLRLHYPDGFIVDPVDSNLKLPFGRFSHMGKNTHGSFDCLFPWGPNEMSEAWVQVVLPSRTYWLEVPYGFTRDPKSLTLPVSKAGAPKFALGMKKLAETSRIVNWKNVYYDVGTIQNDWRLSLFQSNPFDAYSRAILSQEIGNKSWGLHSPITKTAIHQDNGRSLTGRGVSIRIAESGSQRIDEFKYDRNPSGEDRRDWGAVLITVGNKTSNVVVPSSLFRYVHGVSEPHHESTWGK